MNRTQTQPSESRRSSKRMHTQKQAVVVECGKCQNIRRDPGFLGSPEVYLSQPQEAGRILKGRPWGEVGKVGIGGGVRWGGVVLLRTGWSIIGEPWASDRGSYGLLWLLVRLGGKGR